MCPDGELLSTYLDGEIPSPWKEKIALHLEGCVSCRERLSSLAAVRDCVAGAACPDFDAARDRVLAAVESRVKVPREAFWTRKVSLPLPLAAAAALAIAALGFVSIVAPRSGAPAPVMASSSPANAVPASAQAGGNLTDLLKYLDSQDAQVTITVQLPTEAKFNSIGEPELLKASDFGRSPRR
jgi:anti-sigma factor RsiW